MPQNLFRVVERLGLIEDTNGGTNKMAGVENLNIKLLIDSILKLAEYIKGCPFLITIVIVLFGILFIVVVITLTGKSDIVLLIPHSAL